MREEALRVMIWGGGRRGEGTSNVSNVCGVTVVGLYAG